MKYLYQCATAPATVSIPAGLTLEAVRPSLWRGFRLEGEGKSGKRTLVRLAFQAMTLGRARLYCLRKDGALAHTAYVVGRCRKFPFLGKQDYQIGPCRTEEGFRGQGYYSIMLRYLRARVGGAGTVLYMIVDEGNLASRRGVEKAGFQQCGTVRRTGLLKRYIREEEL